MLAVSGPLGMRAREARPRPMSTHWHAHWKAARRQTSAAGEDAGPRAMPRLLPGWGWHVACFWGHSTGAWRHRPHIGKPLLLVYVRGEQRESSCVAIHGPEGFWPTFGGHT